MRIQDVPPSTIVATAAGRESLQTAIETFLADGVRDNFGRAYFGSYEIIEGAPWSGRIIFLRPIKRGAAFPIPTDSSALAKEIYLLTDEARYPSGPSNLESRKGWEVRKTYVMGMKAMVLYPTWVQ